MDTITKPNSTINSNLENEENIQNNDQKEDNQDIEDLLPFHTVQNCNCKSSNDKIIIPKKHINSEKNIPLLIKDILQLQINSDKRNFSAYGIPFETVTVYGNWFGNPTKHCILDDGTGALPVKYFCNKTTKSVINKLRIQLDNRIQYADTTKNEPEIDINLSLNRLLKQIEEVTYIKGINFKNGSSVCVIGKLNIFKNTSQIYLNAFEINVDNEQNRDKELFFKRDLIRYYTTHYISRKIDGSKK